MNNGNLLHVKKSKWDLGFIYFIWTSIIFKFQKSAIVKKLLILLVSDEQEHLNYIV